MAKNSKRRWFKIMAWCVAIAIDHHPKDAALAGIDPEELRTIYSWLLKRKASLVPASPVRKTEEVDEAEFDLDQLPDPVEPVSVVAFDGEPDVDDYLDTA